MLERVAELLEGGMIAFASTRDAHNHPSVHDVIGADVDISTDQLRFFVPARLASTLQQNLEQNPLVALTAAQAPSHEAFQVKGNAEVWGPATGEVEEDARALVDRLQAMMIRQGLPREMVEQLDLFPVVSVTMKVEDLFIQTPGPRAGERAQAGGGS